MLSIVFLFIRLKLLTVLSLNSEFLQVWQSNGWEIGLTNYFFKAVLKDFISVGPYLAVCIWSKQKLIPWSESETRLKPLRHQNTWFYLQTCWEKRSTGVIQQLSFSVLAMGPSLIQRIWKVFFHACSLWYLVSPFLWVYILGSWQSRPWRWGWVISRSIRKN